MAHDPDASDREPTTSAVVDGEPPWAVRRAPFSGNPQVGARGQRTRQRIVDAALEVFGDDGYHQVSIDRITTVAGCSRVAFYQYFSDKEDVLRHLAGQVERQLAASAELLEPVTPDERGWASLRAWVERNAAVQVRYDAVFRAYPAALSTNGEGAGTGAGATRPLYAADEDVVRIRSRLADTGLPPRRLDEVIRMLLEGLSQTTTIAEGLRVAAPKAFPVDRVHDAMADVVHRSFFGLQPGVNVHGSPGTKPPALHFSRGMRRALGQGDDLPELTPAGMRTLTALVVAGREVLIRRGFHATRVDDIVSEAGVSHGAFYRYFRNKEDLARLVTVRSMRNVAVALAEIPSVDLDGPNGTTALRRWLRRYNAVHASEMAMIQVWADAGLADEVVDADSSAAFDWGRRRMVRVLVHRDWGDPETDAVILMALVAAFGRSTRSSATVDAAVHIIERGVLGR